MHKPLLLLLLVLLAFNVRAVQVKPPIAKAVPVKHAPLKLQVDSSNIKLKHFDQAVLDSIAQDKAFNYYTKNYKPHLSLWDRFWRWFWNFIQSLFHDVGPGKTTPFIKFLLIGVATIGLVFLIIKLIKSDLSNIFSRDSKQIDLPYSESLENIHEINFDEEIEQALTNRNYKLAVRLLYLSSLKQLNDAGLINWKIDKTNSAYIDELADTDKRQSFGVLTRQFEYIWYGDFPVDGQSFQNIQTLFMDFKKLLG